MIYDELEHNPPPLPKRWTWVDTTAVIMLATLVVGFVGACFFIWTAAAGPL